MNRALREAAITLASFACMLAAAWPIFLLVRGTPLIVAAVPGLALLALTGFAFRLRGAHGISTLCAQAVVAGIYTVLFLAARGASLSPGALLDLGRSANTTVSTSVAPLVHDTPVVLAFLIATLVIGVVVDVIGATSRVPMLVALPITASFLLATMALGAPLRVWYFIGAAASWALLLWACTPSWRPTRMGAVTWLAMTASAVVTALLLSSVTPHRSTPALGRTGNTSGANTSVNFSSSLDLSKNLHSNNNAPIVIYASSANDPGPIRVTVSEHYADGIWKSDLDTKDATTRQAGVSVDTPGFDSRVDSRLVTFKATLDGMAPPLVPAPAPLVQASFGDSNKTYRTTNDALVPLLKQTPSTYTVTARELLASARPTRV